MLKWQKAILCRATVQLKTFLTAYVLDIALVAVLFSPLIFISNGKD